MYFYWSTGLTIVSQTPLARPPWSRAIGFGQLAAAIHAWVEAQEIAATLPCVPSAAAPPARGIQERFRFSQIGLG